MMTPCHRDKNFQCHKYLHTSKNQRQLSRKLVLFDCKHEAGSVNSSRKFSQFCDFARGLQTFLPDPEGGRLPDSQPADVTVGATGPGQSTTQLSARVPGNTRLSEEALPGCVWLRWLGPGPGSRLGPRKGTMSNVSTDLGRGQKYVYIFCEMYICCGHERQRRCIASCPTNEIGIRNCNCLSEQ